MKLEVVINLLFVFLIYSFIGWILEVIMVAFREKRFVNRGITNGPMCPIYGFASVVLLLTTSDFNNPLLIFAFSVIYGTLIEFLTSKILERFNKSKWWDYSKKRFNLDGYICLDYSIIWGLLGLLLIKFTNPLLIYIFNGINLYISAPIIIILSIITLIDLLTSFITLKFIKIIKIENITNKIGNNIASYIIKRIENAYPSFRKRKKEKVKSEKFASGVGFYKLFWLFFLFSFLGDITEVLFCRYSMGRFMSRSSLLIGEYSLVWGLAVVIASLLLSRYKDKSYTFLFIFGSIMGGAYEYICSVFTEFFFGTIFWDYSRLPLNLNGRINLLFCFFWGFATILFIKFLFPKLSKLIESIPKKAGIILTYILVIFFVVDLLATGCVMMRFNQRQKGIEPHNKIEIICDKYANDEFMKKRWSNMKIPKK